MQFLIGLGNPGQQYQATRHNVGWMWLEYFRQQQGLPSFQDQKKFVAEVSKGNELCLIKPMTYMNKSGEAARKVIHFYDQPTLSQPQLENVVVIHDDLDIPFGSYKIQFGKGPKVHNGINSLRTHLQTDQFWYVRIGVDSRLGDRTLPGHVYVLQPFSSREQEVLDKVFTEISERLPF